MIWIIMNDNLMDLINNLDLEQVMSLLSEVIM